VDTETILDPRTDHDVITAQEVLIPATARKKEAESEERRLFRADSIGGTNPPADSEYWRARRQANDARTAHAQAIDTHAQALNAATRRAQVALDEQIRESWASFMGDVVPLMRAHSEAMERHQSVAGAGGLRFPNVLLSGPPALTTAGFNEWVSYMERNIGL
jgi:hypothetical protein